jgi:hypothetical protein
MSKSVAILFQNYTSADLVISATVSSEDPAFPVSNLYDESRRALVWRSTGTSEWLRWDFGTSSNPRAFVLTASRNFPLKISPTAEIKLQANETDAWTSPSFEIDVPYHYKNLLSFSWTGLAPQGYRYWRLKIDDPDSIYGYVEAGLVYLGDAFSPDRGAAQFPLESNHIDPSSVVFTESGAAFVTSRAKSQRFTVNWGALNPTDVEKFDEIFSLVGISKSFFVVLDPDSVFSTSAAAMTRWCRFDEAPGWSLNRPAYSSYRTVFREGV